MTNSEDQESDENYKAENFIGFKFSKNAMASQDQCNAKDICVVNVSKLANDSNTNSSPVESQIIPSHESGEHSATCNIHPEITNGKLDCPVCTNSYTCSINSSSKTAGGVGKFHIENLENNVPKQTDEKSKIFNSSPSTSKSSNDEMCNGTFDDKSAIEYPIRKQIDFSSNECIICQATFKTKTSLKVHKKKHDDKNPLICKLCKNIFTSRCRLNAHMVKHSNERLFTCNICFATFKYTFLLNQHMITHSDERPHKCNQCQSTFKVKHHLHEHLVRHSSERPFKCDICPSRFKLKIDLTQHVITHSDKRSHKCNLCSLTFKSKRHLHDHLASH